MESMLRISAWFLISMVLINIIGNPFFIGKKREPYSATTYIIGLIVIIPIVLVAGRVLGWW